MRQGALSKENHFDPDLLVDPEFHATGNPQALWSWMRKHNPIYWHQPSNFPGFWSITRHEDVRTVYSNPHIFSSSHGVLLRPIKYGDDPGGGLTLALTDPPRHKKIRSIMADWFSPGYVRTLESLIREKVKYLLLKSIEKGKCNFTNDVSAPLTLSLTCSILGLPEEDHDNILQWAHEAFETGKPLAAQKDFMLYFCELMENKKRNPGNDLASAIVHGIVDDKVLAEKEILLNFENLIGATENAGLSISSGILAFLRYPDSWRKFKEDRKILTTAIEEVLRWASSASHSMRTVKEPFVINDNEFKVGDKVVLWLPSANRDEEIFINPYEFDIMRLPNRHVALGYGEHFCIGNALGRMQMRVLLTELLDLEWQLELDGEPIPLRSIHVNGPEILPIKFIRK